MNVRIPDMDQFRQALADCGRSDAEIEGSMDLAMWAQRAGLVPLFRGPGAKHALALRWSASRREVGSVLTMFACKAELIIELRWLLYEPAFRPGNAGNALKKRLLQTDVTWGRSPAAGGFPNLPLQNSSDAQQSRAVREAVEWILGKLRREQSK